MNIRVYVANLAKYNEGKMVGEWISLPMDEEELEDKIKKILGDDEEYIIHAHEAPFKIGEHNSVDWVNEIAEKIESSDTDKNVIELILSNIDINIAMDVIESNSFRVYHNVSDMEDVAMEYLSETSLLSNLPEEITRYFDYEAYGRDMDGTFLFDNSNKICVEVYDWM